MEPPVKQATFSVVSKHASTTRVGPNKPPFSGLTSRHSERHFHLMYIFAKTLPQFRPQNRKPPAVSSLRCEPDSEGCALCRMRGTPLMAEKVGPPRRSCPLPHDSMTIDSIVDIDSLA